MQNKVILLRQFRYFHCLELKIYYIKKSKSKYKRFKTWQK